MNYFILVILILLPLNCNSEVSKSSGKGFWELIADFDLNLKQKKSTQEIIEKLTFLVKNSDDSIARSNALFLRKIIYYKIYSSEEVLDEYLSENLHLLSEDNSSYLQLYTDYIILLTLLEEDKRVSIMRGKLNLNRDYAPQAYSLALNLYLNRNIADLKKLESHCLSGCNFSLYHISIMEFLKVSDKHVELEQYASNLLKLIVSNKLMIDYVFFSLYLGAYLEWAIEKSSPERAPIDFINESTEGMYDGSFIYKQLKAIRIK